MRLFLLACFLLTTSARAQTVYQTPPPELAQLVDAPNTPGVSLSPEGTTMLLIEQPDLPSIAEVSQPEARLAGLRINPRTNGPSRARGATGLALRSVADTTRRVVTGLPARPVLRSIRWSPDGEHIAFTHDTASGVELYVVDVATAQARRVLGRALNESLTRGFAWLPSSDGLVALVLPQNRPTLPTGDAVPAGPVVQESMGSAAPARTYQDLLSTPEDAQAFEHYATADLVRVALDGSVTPLATAGLFSDASPSPDGRYVLVERLQRPFSYLVPYYRFPRTIEVVDAQTGAPVYTVASLPLQEDVPTGFGSVPTGPRSVGWRADAPSSLVWVEAADGGDARADADIRDRVMLHPVPTRMAPQVLAELPLRYGGIVWGGDDLALVYESWWSTRTRRAYRVAPASPGTQTVVFDYSYEDRYNDPGTPVTEETPQGTEVLKRDGETIYLSGPGATPEGEMPFLRAYNLASGEATELFRSQVPHYERFVDFLPDGRLLTSRESVTEPPNYFAVDAASGARDQLTFFPHPYPELMGVQKEYIQYERADGVALSATLYLPAGYDATRDGPLPTLLWAYPREFKSADAAGQVTGSPFRFNRISYWGAVPYVTRGYAVLDGATIPIVGEGDREPNDTFVEQLVSSAQAAIDEGVRRGVVDADRVAAGGHSYGAFMTANLLAHSDLFKAGIARSGAYNRTLTPFGFQSEERTYWEAPEIYNTMSPFQNAARIDEPLLMIHGMADNNSGTFPIQSERLYAALKGLGQTARLVMLPAESHGYTARESLLHMLWETDRWLERYVKNAAQQDIPVTGADG